MAFDPRALEAERVGLFGGTFDPPHLGHLFVAREAARARALEHVVWVPARRSPHKGGAPTPGAVRAELIALALGDVGALDTASIWRGELERPAPSLTFETVRALVAARREAGRAGGLFLLLGGDQLLGIERWHAVDALFELAEPVVVARSGRASEAAELEARLRGLAQRGALREALAARLIAAMIDPGRVDVVATELRERLAAGEPAPEAGTTPSVLARIGELGLYR